MLVAMIFAPQPPPMNTITFAFARRFLFSSSPSSIARGARTLRTQVPETLKMASWTCSKCTFLNPPTQKSVCEICLSPSASSPSPSSSSSAALGWSCGTCTFSNPSAAVSCQMCGIRSTRGRFALLDELGTFDSDDVVEVDPAVGSVFLPLRRCRNKDTEGNKGCEDVFDESLEGKRDKMQKREGSPVPNAEKDFLKILSYNVWFREDLELHKRMEALGNLIQRNSPDLICFQEVTPNIYRIFGNAAWWKDYECSVTLDMAVTRPYFCMQLSKLPVKKFQQKPFHYSIMGRELCIADVALGVDIRLVVATSHLESPCPAPPKWDQMYSRERVAQAEHSISLLEDSPNAIFCGDMNWDDKLDGPFPIAEGWVDPWLELRPEENGWTYDTKANQMLSGNRTLQKRLDRFACKLQDFKIISIDMIGQEAINGLSYVKEKKIKNQFQKLVLPVLPSDHYGLLLTIQRL